MKKRLKHKWTIYVLIAFWLPIAILVIGEVIRISMGEESRRKMKEEEIKELNKDVR